jgi:ribonuclease R
MTKAKPPAHVPTKQQLRDFIESSPGRVGKRELARAFHMTGENRVLLKELLRELQAEGVIERGGKRQFGRPGALPDVTVIEITGTDTDGELIGRPLVWDSGRPPRIFMAPDRAGAVIGVGDRVLAKLRFIREDLYEGRTIRRVTESPAKVLGVFEGTMEGGRILPTDRRQKADYLVGRGDSMGAEHGELVLGELLPGRHYGLRPAKVVERLGSMANPKAISLVAIYSASIPTEFPADALADARAAGAVPEAGYREDIRAIPLVTIDGEDARDFDDAVYAASDTDPANPGGWLVIVAIADVSWYVRPGAPLDRSAYERGNSVYFPDRVVPMLPEELSNGWCSLRPNEDRGCLAVRMWFDSEGNKLRHKFLRGLMRSSARLTYDLVQKAKDGYPDETTAPLMDTVIHPLYGAWQALHGERARRGVLDLDLPERKVVIGDEGKVVRVEPRPRWDSHRLIEDMMIAANVAAAEELERLGQVCMYRVHDKPAHDKLDALRDFLESMDLRLAPGINITPHHFNKILDKAKDTPQAHLVNEVVLRSQAQAVYSPENLGHFGLGLAKYAHFTSPIRRYADLLVHRALVTGLNMGPGGLADEEKGRFDEIGQHISATERRAAGAERDAINRYTAAFLADRVGASFPARVNGVTRFGLFVTLDETGADGLVPVSTLPEDFYVHDERNHALVGKRTRRSFQLGERLEVLLSEANPLTGGLVFHVVDKTPGAKPRPPSSKPMHPSRKKSPFKRRRS